MLLFVVIFYLVFCSFLFFVFFFFKQKTAYEIGTGDWSSDVCSSDLLTRSTQFCGISLPGGHMCKVSAYADDLVMFCRDKSDLDYVFSFFDKVAIATGSTLSKSKTKVLYLGPTWDSSV